MWGVFAKGWIAALETLIETVENELPDDDYSAVIDIAESMMQAAERPNTASRPTAPCACAGEDACSTQARRLMLRR
jgi:hypothetical protein